MKLQKPLITIIFIVLLGVNLIFFSLTSIGKSISTKEITEKIVNKYDINKTILEDLNVKKNITEYKYSPLVFSYINKEKEEELKEKIIKNIDDNRENLIDEKEITSLLKRSVFTYEIKNGVDTMGIVNSDIELYSYKVSQYINNDFLNTMNFFRIFSSSFFSTIAFSILILLLVGIIIVEKRNGFLISGIITFIYSFFVYFLNNNFFNYEFISNTYFGGLKGLKLSLDNTYMICFILSFVLLLIYIVKYIKKVLRDIRINSYISSWR